MCYWLRESKSSNAEVDYVISRGDWILPIEVKAGKSGSLKSLQQFVLQKKTDLAIRFDVNMPSIQHVRHTTRLKTENKPAAFTLYGSVYFSFRAFFGAPVNLSSISARCTNTASMVSRSET